MSAILQTWPRWRNRWFGVDTWRHLAAADHIRRTGRVFDTMPEHYLIDAPSDYPPVLRVLLAWLPKPVAERSQWCASAMTDACHHGLVFGLVYAMTGRLAVAVAAQACYSLSPLVVMENASLTTRPLSSLLFSLSVFPLIGFLGTGQWGWMAIAAAMLGVLLLTHRLAIQAIVVLVLVMALLSRSWWPLAYLAAGGGVALLLSGGAYRRVLSGHLAMLRCWRANIRNRFAHQVRGFPPPHQKDPDPVFRLYQAIRRLPAMAVVAAHPALPCVLGAYGWLMWRGVWEGGGLPSWLIAWCAVWAGTLWVAGVAIRQIPPIRFLGEGERYLEYANAPAAVVGATVFLSAWTSPAASGIAWGLPAVLLLGGLAPAIALQRVVVLNDTERSVTPALRRIFDHLNGLPGEIRLLTMPTYLADAVMYFTRARVVSTDNSHAHNTRYPGLWPRLTKPLSDIIAQFRVNYVLVNEKFVTLAELQLAEAQVIHRADRYCLLHV